MKHRIQSIINAATDTRNIFLTLGVVCLSCFGFGVTTDPHYVWVGFGSLGMVIVVSAFHLVKLISATHRKHHNAR